MERIEVRVRPIEAAPAGNHLWIVYHRADGSTLSISGGPASYPSLDVQVSKWGPQSWDWQARNTELTQYRTTVAQGPNLSNTFNTMAFMANKIDNANLAYGPLGVNSNATVHTVLQSVGLQVDFDAEFPWQSGPWTPGGSLDLNKIYNLDRKFLWDEAGPDSTPLESLLNGVGYAGGGGMGGGLEGGFRGGSSFLLHGGSGYFQRVGVGVEGYGTSYGWRWIDTSYATRLKPVILDMAGDGLELTPITAAIGFDTHGTGHERSTGWFRDDDAMLVFDANGDGAVNDVHEISFLRYSDTAGTDLEALRVFDTNGDGYLNAGDAQFHQFRLWQDANGNAQSDPGELATLAAHGVTAIGLYPNVGGGYEIDGNQIHGSSLVVKSDGTAGQAYDVALKSTDRGVKFITATPEWTALSVDTGETVAVQTGGGPVTINDLAGFSINGVSFSTFQLGAGDDTVRLTSAGSDRPLHVDLGHGNNFANLGWSTIGGQIRAGDGNDTVTGSQGDDLISVGGGHNILRDHGGDDTYVVKGGSFDLYDPYGDDNDVLYLDATSNDVYFWRDGTGHIKLDHYSQTTGMTYRSFLRSDDAGGLDYIMFTDRVMSRSEINALADQGFGPGSDAPPLDDSDWDGGAYPAMVPDWQYNHHYAANEMLL